MVNPKLIPFSLGFLVLTGKAFAVSVANISDFEANNKDGWVHPISNPNQTVIQMDSPFNNILSVTSSGGSGAGSGRAAAKSSSGLFLG